MQVDNFNPKEALIRYMHGPYIVAICHVAMSSPTSEHRLNHSWKLSNSHLVLLIHYQPKMLFAVVVSVYLSVLSFSSRLFSALLLVFFLPDPSPSLQTMVPAIYDPVSNTYPESYPQRATLYLELPLCSFTEQSKHFPKDLVLCHCNSLFLMLLMRLPHHPSGLFIFIFSCFWASSLDLYAVHLLENRPCFLDRNITLQL